MPLTEKQLLARDAKRDIGAELLESIREMQAGKVGRVHSVTLNEVAEARAKSGLSQSLFAQVLGVSARTLQEWEQGRRKPSGAARSLITIASRHPEIIREVVAA